MSSAFFEAAPGFDQPIAVLKHCHDRIRRQISTLQRLVPHLQKHGANLEAQQAARAVLRYFMQAAPNHHADEEIDLLPLLQSAATGDDASALEQLLPTILDEHQRMAALWCELEPVLAEIAGGTAAVLPPVALNQFADMYLAHMVKEESVLAPMAKRILDPAQMTRLGNAMRERRGIAA